MLAHLRDGAVMLDIGAHHGEFAVPVAYELKQRGWRSQVWSFEPDPENLRCLPHNLAQNGLAEFVRVRPVAVSDVASDQRSCCVRPTTAATRWRTTRNTRSAMNSRP